MSTNAKDELLRAIRECVCKWLSDHGYDGLHPEYGEACFGCDVNEIMNCEELPYHCVPGYKTECSKCIVNTFDGVVVGMPEWCEGQTYVIDDEKLECMNEGPFILFPSDTNWEEYANSVPSEDEEIGVTHGK